MTSSTTTTENQHAFNTATILNDDIDDEKIKFCPDCVCRSFLNRCPNIFSENDDKDDLKSTFKGQIFWKMSNAKMRGGCSGRA